MLFLDRPKEAMSQIIHGAGVVYIKEEGEGIGGGLSTATEDSLWKMPQHLVKTVMSSEWNMYFHTLSPVPPVYVSSSVHVCESACVCVFWWEVK